MYSASFLSTILAIFAMAKSSSSSAIHQKRQFPTVNPGAGLPSLASINLTSADLYTMTRTTLPDGENFSQECGPGDEAQAPISDVTACFNYLVAISDTNCGVGTLCQAGNAVVFSGAGGTSVTACVNIAVVIQEILDRCGGDGGVLGDGSTEDGGEDGPSMVVRVLNSEFP